MYTILGWQNADSTENGCDAERTTDTLKDAKAEARYMLTERYSRACESTSRIVLARIYRGSAIVAELS